MKFSRIICLFLCFLVCLGCFASVPSVYGVVADTGLADGSSDVTNGSHSIDGAVSYLGSEELVENIGAAFLYELNSGTLMYAWNPDAQIYPSSLVKILTALIAVEQGNLEDVVTVTEETLSTVPYDAVSADLLPQEQMSLNDLLYCMMVGSGNDAAAVIAEHISGTQSDFVDEMNRVAQELGCTGTQFKNVHGLHDEGQYTTVRDMARILAAAMQNEKFRVYYSAAAYTVPATNMSEARELSSSNFLINNQSMEIYYDSRVTGGRTGIAEDGTRCLAATAEHNGLQLICVLTGAQSTFAEDGNTMVYGSFKEATALFDAGFNGFKAVQILYAGQALKQCSVVNGTSDVVIGSDLSVCAILPEGVTQTDLAFQYTNYYEELQAPVTAGDKLSLVEVWYGNICIARVDLYAMNDVPSKLDPAGDSIQSKADVSIWMIIVSVAVCLLCIVFVPLFVLRVLRRSAAKKRGKRYRRERRRSR